MERRHEHMDMDMSGMSAGTLTLQDAQRIFWIAVGSAVGFAMLVNMINICICWQRLSAAARGEIDVARPRRFAPRLIATITAVWREASNSSTSLRLYRYGSYDFTTLGHVLVVLAELVLVLVLCFYGLDPTDRWQLEDVGYRTGYVASAQLPLIYILSGKNNIIGFLTGNSYEQLHWLHRWCSRTLWLVVTIHMGFWFRSWAPYDYVRVKMIDDSITQKGFASWCILTWIVISSIAPIRRWNYEVFVIQHVVSIGGFSAAVYLHLLIELRKLVWISIAFALFDRLIRILLLLANNVLVSRQGRHWKNFWAMDATVEPLFGGYTKLVVRHPRLKWRPGQHAFVSCQAIVPLQSHPFTIMSLPEDEKMVFILKAQKGATRKIWNHAGRSERLPLTGSEGALEVETKVTVEGPYGQLRPLQQFDSVVLLAGGVGVTFTLPLLRDLVQRSTSTNKASKHFHLFQFPTASAARSIHFVWVIKSRNQLSWITQELDALVALTRGPSTPTYAFDLEISVYVTCDEVLTAPRKVTSGQARTLGPAMVNECGNAGECCCTRISEERSESNLEIPQPQCNCASLASPEEKGAADKTLPSKPSISNLSTIDDSGVEPHLQRRILFVRSGRPPIKHIIRRSLEHAGGESAIVACGPAGLTQGVRISTVSLSDERAVHKGTGAQGIYLHTETFGL